MNFIMNFEGFEFMGSSFAQEYNNRKYFASFEVVEKNMPEDIRECLRLFLN